METVYLALGSNLEDRAANISRAVQALPPDFNVIDLSPLYETEPAYVLDQPRFYNQVCRATTALSPLPALHRLKVLEAELGRQPGQRFGPRLIDLDLLVYDDLVLDLPELTLPHPRLAERPFVLVPLVEIAPNLVVPGTGVNVTDLLVRLGDTGRSIWRVPVG
jgi:2-amino-4-hydroxy-6-hydroxymethyldihydropteridine diphosphokinase